MNHRSFSVLSVFVVGVLCSWSSVAVAKTWRVSNVDDLKTAFRDAEAGDEIELDDGEYLLSAALRTATAGTKSKPITLKSKRKNKAKLQFNGQEGVVVNHEWWVIDGVWISGCLQGCAAGVHVKATAHNFLLTNSTLTDWSQHVKSSRTSDADGVVKDANIVGNEFYNTVLRDQVGGSTPIDIVGGLRWRIARNYIHDYGGDNNGDYGIFLKGVTRDGLIEQNLVVGSTSAAFARGAIVGISFGGGGTGSQFVPNGDISCEDYNSIARNNIVLNTTDAGLHTKRACGSKFYHNTVYKAGAGLQIQIDGAKDPVVIEHNILGGRITGKSNRTEKNNLLQVTDQQFAALFTDPAGYDFSIKPGGVDLLFKVDTMADVQDDYCGVARSGKTSYGAIVTMDPRCKVWPWPTDRSWVGDSPGEDMGVGADMGVDISDDMMSSDMGAADMPGDDMSSDMTMADMPGTDMSGGPGTLPSVGGGSQGRNDDGCAATPGSSPTSPWAASLVVAMMLFWRRKKASNSANIG